MSFDLGFIGGGNMSTAIVKGISKNNSHPASKIWVSGPHLENLTEWTNLGMNATNKNGEVFRNCDVIFLGVKPGMLNRAVTDCLDTMKACHNQSKKLIISMLAGITIEDLHKALAVLSQKMAVVRIMPNTPVMVGAGACLYTPDSNANKADCSLVELLMGGCGLVEYVPESLMDSLGSLVGCGPAYMYIVIEALADGAVKQGAPRAQALRLAAQVLIGSGLMVQQSGKHPGLLKDEVCSPGGTTIAGVAELEDGNIRATGDVQSSMDYGRVHSDTEEVIERVYSDSDEEREFQERRKWYKELVHKKFLKKQIKM